MNPKLTVERLRRRALVYIRQSSPIQVQHHQESTRLQYGLVERARQLGFVDVQLIDDDQGRSGDGRVERPGFQRLAAEVCSGEVGAVFCLEASRLARNGRDWHHLIELCGMVDAVMELGSVRQVLVWFRKQNISLPALSRRPEESKLIWKPPVYRTAWAILTNPLYAGAYVYGRREVRTQILDGRARKSKGRRKPRSAWSVLIRDHHPGYVDWERYEQNQALIMANTHMKSNGEAKAGRGGRALLSGMVRCRRCGRMLHVSYVGKDHAIPRYECNDANLRQGERRCLSFSGLWVDEAVAREVLEAISGNAVEAALEAAQQIEQQRHELRQSLALEVEQARYEARLAARRYEAVDPDQRLVAAELEARWNAALEKTRDLEQKLQEFDVGTKKVSLPSKELLLSLAQDLPAVWNSPSSDMRLKQRIMRILVEEIIAGVDDNSRNIVLLIHWAGGRHSELRLKKREIGQHRRCTSVEAVEVVRQMAGRFTDELIAATLNRLGMRTGVGNTWDKDRVYSLRNHHRLPSFDPQHPHTTATLKEAAQRLQVSEGTVRQMIEQKKLPATQVVEYAPWEIPVEALDSEEIRKIVGEVKRGTARPQKQNAENQRTLFSVI